MALANLLSPLEWFFVILLGTIPLIGAIFHIYMMFMGRGTLSQHDEGVDKVVNKSAGKDME